MEIMEQIDSILTHYEILMNNKRSTDSIDLLIKNWTKSTTENNPDELNKMALLAMRKLKKGKCNDFRSFKINYFDTYIKYKVLRLIQMLIDKYTEDANIVKNALLNLLPVIKLSSGINSIKTIPWHRLVFKRKMDNIARFFKLKQRHIIYREVYIAYLVQQRDTNPLRCPQLYSTANLVCAQPYTNVDLLSNQFPDLILNPYLTNMHDINNIRSVNMALYLQYNSHTMKKIAVQNLKDIFTNFFMISADKLTTALLSCGAILGGSIVTQSFHGDAETVFKTSDANFYVPVKSDSTALEDLILSSGYELYTTDLPLSLLHNHLATNYMDSYFYSASVSYRFSSSILLVDNYRNDFGKKVQIIKVKSATDVETTFDFGQFVVHHYDLTFLQNFFDGSNLHTNDFHGVVKKTGSVTAFVRSACTVDASTAKYRELLRNWYRSTTATTIRCIKYQQRGFTIDNVPEHSLVTELGIL